MKISIGLNAKSIENAKQQLLEVKKKFQDGTIMREFFVECKNYLLQQMKIYLDHSGLGYEVISNIENSWDFEISNNKLTMINTDDKAVFVEFGVGIEGQSDSHPNSSEEGYRYNIPTSNKYWDGSWDFIINDLSNLDLPLDKVGISDNGNEYRISTQGTKGVWYAYNAIQDLKMNRKEIWKKVKERVIG